MCPLSQQLEKADQERFELQKQLKALESGSALAAQKVCFAFSYFMNLTCLFHKTFPQNAFQVLYL